MIIITDHFSTKMLPEDQNNPSVTFTHIHRDRILLPDKYELAIINPEHAETIALDLNLPDPVRLNWVRTCENEDAEEIHLGKNVLLIATVTDNKVEEYWSAHQALTDLGIKRYNL